jgi:hypothetical protein
MACQFSYRPKPSMALIHLSRSMLRVGSWLFGEMIGNGNIVCTRLPRTGQRQNDEMERLNG